MKTHITMSALVLLIMAASVHAQDSALSRQTLAGLPGVMVRVEPLVPEVEDKGITSAVIAAQVESRLLEAGIHVYKSGDPELAPGLQTLYVEVNAMLDEYNTGRCLWSVRVDLTQAVRMERKSDTHAVMASTWSVGGVGFVPREWREAIVEDVLAYVDRFIEAFAAANPDGIAP